LSNAYFSPVFSKDIETDQIGGKINKKKENDRKEKEVYICRERKRGLSVFQNALHIVRDIEEFDGLTALPHQCVSLVTWLQCKKPKPQLHPKLSLTKNKPREKPFSNYSILWHTHKT
jgi:hypothetical protein